MEEIKLNVYKEVNKIQVIRAIQAISEINVKLYISPINEFKLKPVLSLFEITYAGEFSNLNIDVLDIIRIDHSKPSTKIGTLERPLIFPKATFNFLKEKWTSERPFRFYFIGLLTKKRKIVLKEWFKTQNINFLYSFCLCNTKVITLCNFLKKVLHLNEKIHIWPSSSGRSFPLKTWDQKYYDVLLNSQFTICPSGDYTWTYRFFESIICGSIPVIEKYCDSFEGYKFKYLKDNPNSFVWSRKDAEYNFYKCLDQLTVPVELLEDSIRQVVLSK